MHITRDNLNKTVPNATKRQFERTVKEWKNKGIVKGYLEYLITSLGKYTYSNLLKILIYGIYAAKEQQIYSYSKGILLNVANDTYKQAKKERPNCPVGIPEILTWAYISKWLSVVSANVTYKDYLSLLTMAASDEMYSSFLGFVNQDIEIDEDDLSKLINKQQNRVISIKEKDGDYSFSGVLENMTKTVGNKAYIEPFPNEQCKFVAELDSHTTKMCLSLNDQVFNTKDKNIFYRYSDVLKNKKRYEIDGLIEGINLPPIVDHFHWCRSTITYQFERPIDELEKEIFGIELDSYNLLKDAREKGLILDKINKEKQAKHCDKNKNFDSKRSYIYGDVEDAEKLYKKYSGHGYAVANVRGGIRENVKTNEVIGVHQKKENDDVSEKYSSRVVTIIYSKTGAHLYAGEEKNEKHKRNYKGIE